MQPANAMIVSAIFRRGWMKSVRVCASLAVLFLGVMAHLSAQSATSTLHIQSGSQQTALTLDALKVMPQKTVKFHNVHTSADETYSGVPLIDLLAPLGVPHGKDLHGKALSEYVVATGSDGYKAVL